MENLNYCVDCRRIAYLDKQCSYCQSENMKRFMRKSPVNVIGTKIKGKFIRVKGQMLEIVCVDENNTKALRQYEAEKLRKIL